MNYLFVMPRFRQNANETYKFPLGMAYVSASLKQIQTNVFCLNLNVNFKTIEEEVREAIKKYDADVIATGGLSPNFRQIRTIISTAKSCKPDIITMVGGGLLTATPEVIMRGIPDLDIGMIAEGEITIRELAGALEKGEELGTVKGIIYRKPDRAVVRTEEREDIQNLDVLPFPDYEGFQFDGKNEVSICTSRSCPFSCSFCFHTCGKKYRSRSMDNVFKEIDWLVEKYDIKSLGILDELFSIDIVRMKSFCERIQDYNIKWSCQMRVDRMSVEMLTMMKKAGCVSISFGIESADNRVLESMEKHITIEKVEEALTMAQKAGICPFGNLLLGEKADDLESFQKCLEWYQAHPDIQLGFNKILVLPGSKLYRYAVANGYIQDEVKYLEDENYAINITKMDDEQYKKCVEIMDDVVARREYPLKNEIVAGYAPKTHRAIVTGECPLCGKKITFLSNDCFAIKNGSCPECGRPYTANLFNLKKEELEKRVKKQWENKNVVIWGVGNQALKFFYQSELFLYDNIWIIDKNRMKQRAIQGKQIYSIEKMDEIEGNIVLVGTDSPVTNTAIKKFVEEKYPKVKEVGNLNDYLFKIVKEVIEDGQV